MTENPVILGVRYNTAGASSTCGVCGHTFKAEVGFAAWVDGTQDLACNACTSVHAPELDALLAKLIDDDYEPEFEPWDGCTCGPQGPAHVYVSTRGTEVVHRPWCECHPPDCARADCCAYDGRLTSPCDGTTCLHVTAVQDEDAHYEGGGERLHTHRGDPHWFDTSEPWDAPPTGRRHLSLVPGGQA